MLIQILWCTTVVLQHTEIRVGTGTGTEGKIRVRVVPFGYDTGREQAVPVFFLDFLYRGIIF